MNNSIQSSAEKQPERVWAGAAQFNVALGDLDANVDSAADAIDAQGASCADIVVLPEMWSCGFDHSALARHADRTPEILEILSRKAIQHRIIVAGSLPEAVGDQIFNTFYVIDKNGQVAGTYRKMHLFTPTGEPLHFAAGDRVAVVKTSVGPVGLAVCYDLRFPELFRAITLQGARMILVCAQWPTSRIRHWDVLLQARAIENQIFILGANRCGQDPGCTYGGHSAVVSPNGMLLAQTGSSAANICAKLSFAEMDLFRSQIPCLNDRRGEFY